MKVIGRLRCPCTYDWLELEVLNSKIQVAALWKLCINRNLRWE